MWELDCEEGWVPKNWCFWTVVLEKTLESPLDFKEIQPVHSEGDQPRDFFGRNDAKPETPVLWPPHAKSWLIGKDSDAGRDWGQKEKGTTKDEMAGWHHGLNGRESEWTPSDGDGQGGLACCDSWGCKETDMTERLNWTEYFSFSYSSYYHYINISFYCACQHKKVYIQLVHSYHLPQQWKTKRFYSVRNKRKIPCLATSWCSLIHWLGSTHHQVGDWPQVSFCSVPFYLQPDSHE